MLITDFLSWWYLIGFRKFIGRLNLRLVKITDFFSLELLVKTLFTPFRLIDSYSTRGDSLDEKFRGLIDKLIACLIGGMIRSTVLIVGVFTIIATFVINLCQIVLWLVTPILPVIGAILLAMGV